MAAMIAGMSGDGTGGGLSNRQTLRRVVISVACGLLVVVVGSRFNRPNRMRIPDQPPRVADRVLPILQLDTTSLAAVVDSINRASERTVQLESSHLNDAEHQTNQWPAPPPMRNVRLGTALAMATEGCQEYRGGAELREENGALIISGPGSATSPDPAARLYDVCDILAEAEAWSTPLRPLHPRPPQQQGLFSSGYYGDYGPIRAAEIAAMIRDTIYPQLWDDPQRNWQANGWGGWVFVYASAAAHRDVERLLALVRRGESEPVRQKVTHR
jgi:hypothetical protein